MVTVLPICVNRKKPWFRDGYSTAQKDSVPASYRIEQKLAQPRDRFSYRNIKIQI